MATKTKASHTPTPWRIRSVSVGGHREIAGANEAPVCVVDGIGPVLDEQDANAAFIVRAVNAHDDLLAACKAITSEFDGQCPPNINSETWAILRAAIAKAEAQ